MEYVTSADGISVDHSDDGFRDRTDRLVEIEYIEAGHSLLVYVAADAFYLLIAARAERLITAPVRMMTPMSEASRQ